MYACANNDFYSAGLICIDLKSFLEANWFSERQFVISWFGYGSLRPLVAPLVLCGCRCRFNRSDSSRSQKNTHRAGWGSWRGPSQVNRLLSFPRPSILEPEHMGKWPPIIKLTPPRGCSCGYMCKNNDIWEETLWGGVQAHASKLVPTGCWFHQISAFSCKFPFYLEPTHQTHTLASSDPGGNLITVLPVPLPFPIGWEVWDMLIKPELIKRSLGLRVSLPLTSLTAVSVRHLRLINKKALSRLWINAY